MSSNPKPRNPALLEFVENFPMPPVRKAAMRHRAGIRRSCFYPVMGPYVQMLKLHNHYLKPNVFSGVEEEYWFIRRTAGLLDVTGEEVIEVTGPDALTLMDRVVPRDLSKLANGRSMYCIMCYETGGIVEDAILVRFADDRLWWVGGPGYSEHWIYLNAQGLDVEIVSHNDSLHVASLQGPLSREILDGLCDLDIGALPVFGVGEGRICGVPATLTRTGYTAVLGFDIYVGVERGAELFAGLLDAVWARGGGLCGSESLNHRRMDAAILNFSIDFDWQHTPYDVGLGWMVNFKKVVDFTGRRKLEALSKTPAERKLVGLILEGDPPAAGAPLVADGSAVGEITSAVRSPSLEQTIALGWVPAALGETGSELTVETDGSRFRATVAETPFLDPERKLMRA